MSSHVELCDLSYFPKHSQTQALQVRCFRRRRRRECQAIDLSLRENDHQFFSGMFRQTSLWSDFVLCLALLTRAHNNSLLLHREFIVWCRLILPMFDFYCKHRGNLSFVFAEWEECLCRELEGLRGHLHFGWPFQFTLTSWIALFLLSLAFLFVVEEHITCQAFKNRLEKVIERESRQDQEQLKAMKMTSSSLVQEIESTNGQSNWKTEGRSCKISGPRETRLRYIFEKRARKGMTVSDDGLLLSYVFFSHTSCAKESFFSRMTFLPQINVLKILCVVEDESLRHTNHCHKTRKLLLSQTHIYKESGVAYDILWTVSRMSSAETKVMSLPNTRLLLHCPRFALKSFTAFRTKRRSTYCVSGTLQSLYSRVIFTEGWGGRLSYCNLETSVLKYRQVLVTFCFWLLSRMWWERFSENSSAVITGQR